MSKALIIDCGLKHTHPTIKKNEMKLFHLLNKNIRTDIRSSYGLDVKIVKDYDIIVFAFEIILRGIPSTALELFDEMIKEGITNKRVYAMIFNDEFEVYKCNSSENVVELFCDHAGNEFGGSLKICSHLLTDKIPAKYLVANNVKKFSTAITNNEEVYLEYTYPTLSQFVKESNALIKKGKLYQRNK